MQNFRQQNLQGHSFRGQELIDADFTGANLRSADFRGATLINAKFSQARFGKSGLQRISLFFANLILGFVIGVFSLIGHFFMSSFAHDMSAAFFSNGSADAGLYYLTSGYGLGLGFSVWMALRQQSWRFAIGFLTLVGAGAVAGMVEVGLTPWKWVLGTGAIMLEITVTVMGMLTGALAVVGGGALALAVVALVAGGIVKVTAVALATIALSIEFILLGWYLGGRSFKYEEALLWPLRTLNLKWRSWGSTDFSGATMTEVGFCGADLKHVQFSGAKFIRCDFSGTENLHLANTLNTPLQPLAVRQLVLTKHTELRDFSFFNLRGVVFAGLNLQHCRFYHADLSEADFSGCNLSDCDFSEAMALGTLFKQAIFTGATLDNWSIDKHTQFSGAEAKFVYLKRNRSERNPPQGEFATGDFTKLYQEIANTVDFIAHSLAELEALLRAIETIKANGGDIFIQQIERKADSVVMRVQSEGSDEIDKAAIYAEIMQQKELELKAIQQKYEQKLLVQQHEHALEKEKIRHKAETEKSDLLAGFLSQALDKSVTINTGNHGDIHMNDNRRTIKNANFINSPVNLGDHNTQSNAIQQLPDSQSELKAVLLQIAELLQHNAVAGHDRQQEED